MINASCLIVGMIWIFHFYSSGLEALLNIVNRFWVFSFLFFLKVSSLNAQIILFAFKVGIDKLLKLYSIMKEILKFRPILKICMLWKLFDIKITITGSYNAQLY